MPSPEARTEYSPQLKLRAALSAFLFIAIAASPSAPVASSPDETLREHCQEKYPLSPSPITRSVFEDSQSIASRSPSTEFRRSIKEAIRGETISYLNSSERSDRFANRVGAFAAQMVEQANAGDERYEFIPEDSSDPAPNDFIGFGTLYKNVDAPYVYGKGTVVAQASSDNIYRYKNGTYYAGPNPYHLTVSYHEAVAEFWAPEGLGLDRCASTPDNGATQGWRVSYDEGGVVPMSTIRWMGGYI